MNTTHTHTTPTHPVRRAIQYGVYTLTGTVVEDHGSWVMIKVDMAARDLHSGRPITDLLPSVCGRDVPFLKADTTPMTTPSLVKGSDIH